MSAPNRNVLWGRALADELARGGVDSVVVSPGSRSTPLVTAVEEHDDLHVFSVLDERSAAYFALGRARRTGTVTPLICTSGTAAANYHPAVIEASQSRVPLLLLTADRPPELRDSGANQTVDQEKLYGDAVRWYKDLPEPEAEARKLRSLRTTVARALTEATGTPSGPVHLNCPFRKPLEPTPVAGDVPADLDPLAAVGRDDGRPFVATTAGTPQLDRRDLQRLAESLSVERGLIVAGPADPPGVDPQAVTALAHATGFPIVADPLSGLRFGGHTRVTTTVGGYDGYLDPRVTDDWPDPDAVLRIGASPTSKRLRKYLARTDARQFVVDPAGAWREAEFTATDLVVADPSRLAGRLAELVGGPDAPDWRERWADADRTHREVVGDATGDGAGGYFEGTVLADVADLAPEPATLVVSNSNPVRDADRYMPPAAAGYTVLGNRGASGIDGVVSTALGAGSATTDHLTLVIGDLAYYHDSNGLLSVLRCGVDATIVLIGNDGGGIFYRLPIESFDPPFTEAFKTPHGLDFEPTADLYALGYTAVDDREAFCDAYADSVASEGTDVIDVRTNGEASQRTRERLVEETVAELAE
ncbi:2-succinyl-5-enolpyruvyl-6-hydroxy-3-cyclohexene-1-carboxylic-acid synthase [Haloplanus aerogenes]|uniref:2-succinyl-5-enolpyruvyl-6-hydroxy-3-cyclohexene-1-carboxylate synthase n=1 Tax=Haloplanus aerogenes TaxID=660522 RepID=A0A3G8QT03_9EURY|nr:2-succinyl-5-enolpyruvyl-6-hydroxy-3-cyclohexene-1-carboxylic-acid synthase [Haloplanus aerogenes]AZH25683.1 2-succinyl-5-enolpyruvyl-6-hydroxy-3-cyclohexene-1-carboxylic-acid synthase [Haloplanus aerogenes]RMB25414.1 2-succinyl-5-enolpyruvyl-6-hydroxy-3-cyclohexene-1-carboxylate synthase [Haloplanus aerogenes]